MKNVVGLFLVLFLCGQLSGQTVFNKSYSCKWISGDLLMNITEAGIVQTFDSSYVIAGTTQYGAMLIKINVQGDTIWSRELTGNFSNGASIYNTIDNGLLLNYGSGSGNSTLIKTDSAGNVQWANQYGDSSIYIQLVGNIISKSDGTFIACGLVSLLSFPGIYWGSIIDISPYGLITGIRGIGRSPQNLGILQTNDGGYFISLITNVNFTATEVLVKLDSNENVLWRKEISLGHNNSAFTSVFVNQFVDSSFIFGGAIYDPQYGGQGAYLIKTDPSGNLIWAYMYAVDGQPNLGFLSSGGSTIIFYRNIPDNTGRQIIIDNSGSFVSEIKYNQDYYLIGFTATNDNGYIAGFFDYDGFRVIKTDSIGLTSCNFATEASEYRYTLNLASQLNSDTNFITTAPTIPVSVLFSRHLPFTTDVCSVTGLENSTSQSDISIYPNPASSNFIFNFNATIVPQETKLVLYDCLGNKIREENIDQQKTIITRGNLAPGIYFWQIKTEAELLGSGKIIVQQ